MRLKTERPLTLPSSTILAILDGGCREYRMDCEHSFDKTPSAGWMQEFSPFGVPGHKLWVREAWQPVLLGDVAGVSYDKGAEVHWFAPGSEGSKQAYQYAVKDPRIRSPMYMPRWASRLTLEVKNVRVERIAAPAYKPNPWQWVLQFEVCG